MAPAMTSPRTFALSLPVAIAAVFPSAAFAAEQFSDVSPSHVAYSAVMYLRDQGVLQGYADNTFRPDALVNRAEALKIIVAPYANKDLLAAAKTSDFTDVPDGAWFLPYVEVARKPMGVIDGPPETTAFNPTRNVNKAEFIKMLLVANKIDSATALGELKTGLSVDVPDAGAWFFPHMRYAIASSMTMVDEFGNLNPGQELSRAQVALLLYRLEMFKKGQRTQALLSESDTELKNVLQLFKNQDYVNAKYAAARSTVAARGALISAPSEAIVKGAVKMSEGFQTLVEAAQAGSQGDLDAAVDLSGDAWDSSTKAMGFNPGLKPLAEQLQAIAKTIADQAREMRASGQQ